MIRQFTMTLLRASSLMLALVASVPVLVSEAAAQGCIPVVYAFRHAEETKPGNPLFMLTPTGQAHANLYPSMISAFQGTNGFCPVAKVYATTPDDKVPPCGNACQSTTNPYDTGTPLAQAIQGTLPIKAVGGNKLYEYLGNGNYPPSVDPKANPYYPPFSYDTATAVALRAELVATANQAKSSAIFWTSQGLHALGGAIINGTSLVPDKNAKTPDVPPRNSVYVFKANNSPGGVTGFTDTPSPKDRYMQCFNHVETLQSLGGKPTFVPPTGDPPTPLYYCGYGSEASPGGPPADKCAAGAQCGTIPNDQNKNLLGKICVTVPNAPTDILPDTRVTGFYGACK